MGQPQPTCQTLELRGSGGGSHSREIQVRAVRGTSTGGPGKTSSEEGRSRSQGPSTSCLPFTLARRPMLSLPSEAKTGYPFIHS